MSNKKEPKKLSISSTKEIYRQAEELSLDLFGTVNVSNYVNHAIMTNYKKLKK